MSDLRDNPKRYLAPYTTTRCGTAGAVGRAPSDPPSSGHVAGWHANLLDQDEPLKYLVEKRGLSLATIKTAQLGYGESFFPGMPTGFKFPVFDAAGEITSLQERFWPNLWHPRDATRKPRKTRTPGGDGRASHFYPELPGAKEVVLLAGPNDALIARQLGLANATTTLAGAQLPSSLLSDLVGRTVFVVYDVGEEDLAERDARRIRSAGARAYAVKLPLPEEGDDLSDWFVKYECSREEFDAVLLDTRRREGGRHE